MRRPIALTIAGSDPSGGAGLQADLKTFHQHRVYGAAVVTLLTAQSTIGVSAVKVVEQDFLLQQLDYLLEDLQPDAAKAGALGNEKNIVALASRVECFRFPLVVDPVMISKHGAPLLPTAAVEVLKRELLPKAYLVTPNLEEAGVLVGRQLLNESDMQRAAIEIAEMGPVNVLIKGGHLEGQQALDLLYSNGEFFRFSSERYDTRSTHGTGCVFSAAITAGLAQRLELVEAVERAKGFISHAISGAEPIGRGMGPTNLFVVPG